MSINNAEQDNMIPPLTMSGSIQPVIILLTLTLWYCIVKNRLLIFILSEHTLLTKMAYLDRELL